MRGELAVAQESFVCELLLCIAYRISSALITATQRAWIKWLVPSDVTGASGRFRP